MTFESNQGHIYTVLEAIHHRLVNSIVKCHMNLISLNLFRKALMYAQDIRKKGAILIRLGKIIPPSSTIYIVDHNVQDLDQLNGLLIIWIWVFFSSPDLKCHVSFCQYEEEFEDTKEVIRIRKSNKMIQHNGEKEVQNGPTTIPAPLVICWTNSFLRCLLSNLFSMIRLIIQHGCCYYK